MAQRGARWAVAGVLVGVAAALVIWAPAAWLAQALGGSDGRLLLADARGTVWRGSAVVVLSGGPGSRDASALPGRLHWTLGLDGSALGLRAMHACCLHGELALRVVPAPGRVRFELPPRAGDAQAVGVWPAGWLAGLGTPFNTLQPAGALRLRSPGLALEQVQGRWLFSGSAELHVDALASRVSTLDELGSYRIAMVGDPAGGAAKLELATKAGALQLAGGGTLLGSGPGSGLRFKGTAGAAEGYEAVLSNLLNIIGRRQGTQAVISIG